MNDYYIYFHLRKDTNKVFYIGKGRQKRAYIQRSRSNYWKNIVNKVGYTVEFIEENLTHEQACQKEIYWIAQFGRLDIGTGCLVNCTNGGEGSFGRQVSEKSREAQVKRWKERPLRKGAKLTEEHKKQISLRHKGKTMTPEQKLRMSLSRLGKHYYINNGKCKMFFENEVPEGWKRR